MYRTHRTITDFTQTYKTHQLWIKLCTNATTASVSQSHGDCVVTCYWGVCKYYKMCKKYLACVIITFHNHTQHAIHPVILITTNMLTES